MENPDLSLQNLNSLLIFMGLAVSFSSLQDSARVQNKFLKRIWRHPIKGKILIAIICIQILFLLSFGLFGYYFKKDVATKDIFIGVMVFGIGMFGYLKTAIEIFDHHRIDKNE
ncbi:hypothetical protein [Persicobacter diffluens]|uniref:Uncharacterized protein n=1 Tax=Persicobacter diffluens TaxID=981 RepID=A0AAN4W0P9_9BACT|nr:hypothetical protein PEDI_35290 [Persicobacter diffluens]